MNITTKTLDEIAALGLDLTLRYLALLVLAAIVFTVLAAGAATLVLDLPFLDTLVVLAVLATLAIVWFVVRTHSTVIGWVAKGFAVMTGNAPALAPETEPEATRALITSGVSEPELIGGIDVDDLHYLCRLIIRRNKWTAEVLEGVELPRSHTVITNKDTRDGQGNLQATTYARIMKLFEDTGVLVDRAKGQTGNLTVTNPDDMLRKLRGIGTSQ